jgi:hypothetical protein
MDMIMALWYLRGLDLFLEYLSVRTCLLDDHLENSAAIRLEWDALS